MSVQTLPPVLPVQSLDRPVEYTLTAAEVAQVREITLPDLYGDPRNTDFYEQSWAALEQLPAGLRNFLTNFRRTEPSAACLIHGFPVNDTEVGPTPDHWRHALDVKSVRPQEIVLALCGLLLGEPFGWATLQEGSIVQNVLPIQGEETKQSGYGSESLLEFHTEDGFHPHRCDYLMLFGLRNSDEVPTIVSSVRDVNLDPRDREILSQDRYFIFPDTEHIRQLALRDPEHPALERMRHLVTNPVPTAVLFGNQLSPYLRIDRPFMRCVGDDVDAARALDNLMAELQRVQQEVVVGPGTLLVVDNYLAVHGRRSFTARYDGTDRWLKKLTVSRNLRRSRSAFTDDHRILV